MNRIRSKKDQEKYQKEMLNDSENNVEAQINYYTDNFYDPISGLPVYDINLKYPNNEIVKIQVTEDWLYCYKCNCPSVSPVCHHIVLARQYLQTTKLKYPITNIRSDYVQPESEEYLEFKKRFGIKFVKPETLPEIGDAQDDPLPF